MKTKVYYIRSNVHRKITIAHLSDLHGKSCDNLLDKVRAAEADIIAITGDFSKDWRASDKESLELLEELSRIAPTFYSLGNHEIGVTEEDMRKITGAGATVLDNRYAEVLGIKIGGLTSGFIRSNVDLSPQYCIKIPR